MILRDFDRRSIKIGRIVFQYRKQHFADPDMVSLLVIAMSEAFFPVALYLLEIYKRRASYFHLHFEQTKILIQGPG